MDSKSQQVEEIVEPHELVHSIGCVECPPTCTTCCSALSAPDKSAFRFQSNLPSDLDIGSGVSLHKTRSNSWPYTDTKIVSNFNLIPSLQPLVSSVGVAEHSSLLATDNTPLEAVHIERSQDSSRTEPEQSPGKKYSTHRGWKDKGPTRSLTPKEKMKWAKSPPKERVPSYRSNRSGSKSSDKSKKISKGNKEFHSRPGQIIASASVFEPSQSEMVAKSLPARESLLLKAAKTNDNYFETESTSGAKNRDISSRKDYFGNPINQSSVKPGKDTPSFDASLDTSGARMASPSSSIASTKRGLEWDSGADVGYRFQPCPASPLSTIDRLALERGTAALQLGRSAGPDQSQTARIASVECSHSDTVQKGYPVSGGDPLAQSTPLELARKPFKVTQDEISPIAVEATTLARQLSVSANDLRLTSLQSEGNLNFIVFPRRKSDSSSLSGQGSDKDDKSKLSPVTILHMNTDKSVQTTNLICQHTVAVQVEGSVPTDNGSSSEIKSSKAVTAPALSKADVLGRYINNVMRNSKNHHKSLNEIKIASTYPRTRHDEPSSHISGSQNTFNEKRTHHMTSKSGKQTEHSCHADCKGAHRKVLNYTESTNEHSASSCTSPRMDDEGSTSSCYFNETPRSANATNEQGTIGSANSFEYLPGHIYENNSKLSVAQGSDQPSNGSSTWGVDSKSFEREMDRGVKNFFNLVRGNREVDAKKKEELIKKFVKKITGAEYSEDNESSVTGTSVVYVANPVTSNVFNKKASREKSTQVRLVSESSEADSSNVASPKPDSESSSLDQHCKLFSRGSDCAVSEGYSLPRNSSSRRSYSSTLDRDWRKPVTQSEKKLSQQSQSHNLPDEQTSRELARINEKINRLNDLKLVLERKDMLQGNRNNNEKRQPDISPVNSRMSENETSVKESSNSGSLEPSTSPVWSSHIRLQDRNTREVFTQMPSTSSFKRPTRPAPRSVSSTNRVPQSIISSDTSLDHRVKQGQINVFVQTMKHQELDPLCCCQCKKKLLHLKKKHEATSSVNHCHCNCHPAKPIHNMTVDSQEINSQTPLKAVNSGFKGQLPVSNILPQSVCQNCNRPPSVLPTSWCQTPQHVRASTVISNQSSVSKNVIQASSHMDPVVCPQWYTNTSQNVQVPYEYNYCGEDIPAASLRKETQPEQEVGRGDVRKNPCICQCALAKDGEAWDVSPISQQHAAETPRPVGYLLTFESPSDEGSSTDTKSKHSLQEVRVKVPSRKTRPSPKIDVEVQRRTSEKSVPGQQTVGVEVHSLTSQGVEVENSSLMRDGRGRLVLNLDMKIPRNRKRQENRVQDNDVFSRLTLQECLQLRRPDYIHTAEYRRKCLAELAVLRELRHDARQRLIALASVPGTVVSADLVLESARSLPPPPLAVKRVFSQHSMLRQTKRVQQKCSEVVNKKVEMKRKEDYRTNRLMAEIFTRKLQKNVLKGEVNLSNSVSVISTLP